MSGSFREALRRHGRLHAALASTWTILIVLALRSPGRGGSTGVGTGIGWWSYLATQLPAIVRYLQLAFWPNPLGSGLRSSCREGSSAQSKRHVSQFLSS